VKLTKSQSLNFDLIRIGFKLQFSKEPEVSTYFVDIEKTLVRAILEIVEKDDGRLLSLVTSWLVVHHRQVNIGKLAKYVNGITNNQPAAIVMKALVNYIAQKKYPAWRKSVHKIQAEGSFAFFNREVSSFDTSARSTTVEEFRVCGFYTTITSLRIRESDIETPEELAKLNHQYANRLLVGSNWRSDIVTLKQQGYESPYAIAKELGLSYSSVHEAYRALDKLAG